MLGNTYLTGGAQFVTMFLLTWQRTQELVHAKEFSDGKPGWVQISPGRLKVSEGGIATFICATNVGHTPNIYFRKDGEKLPRNKGSIGFYRIWGGAILRIESVAKEHNTFFECIVEHPEIETLSVHGLLMVYGPNETPEGYPVIVEHPHLRMIEEGNWVALFCNVQGNPKPNVVWIKDYMPINMESSRYTIFGNGSLQIAYAESEDSGVYECVGENELGVTYSLPGRIIVEEYTWPD